jgi:hypothetical protein
VGNTVATGRQTTKQSTAAARRRRVVRIHHGVGAS